MKIATWNVNSIRTRLGRVRAFLEREQPDVLCLQELKAPEDRFPYDAFRSLGYEAAVHGQKTYNGVAVLSRVGLAEIERGFGDGEDDPQARMIGARVDGLRVLSLYVPNGASVGSEKYAYKLSWMKRLRAYLERARDPQEPLLLCGDFNVAPEDRDVANPDDWHDSVLCHPEIRAALGEITAWGLVDTFRLNHPESGHYTWWDYRRLAFPRGDGLRIDHIFATEPLARRCVSAAIDRNERKGKQPSDHAPVSVVLDLEGA
ncbi:MAG: exodeoxyribonuclease III [Myxococcota bacterium]